MGKTRSKATAEEISSAFQTDEGFKAVASRLGMSPNTLRVIWKREFGEDAFKERGKKLQAAAARKTCLATAASRTYKEIEIKCSQCGGVVSKRANQVAQTDVTTFVCDDCLYDRECPICGKRVIGQKGLSGHFRHQSEDVAHQEYLEKQEENKWAEKIEDQDFVVCQLCGKRAFTLARHLKAVHGITADQYRDQFPGALIRCTSLTEKRSKAIKNREGGFGKGATKEIICPDCGCVHTVSKFLSEDVHNPRCPECRFNPLPLG